MRAFLPLVCALVWAAAALVARARGFSCVSDDDFARVAIAQDFAAAPRLDPSGTSWLPFPFWTTGAAMMLFGRSLAVAQGVAVAMAAASGALLFAAGRRLGLGPTSAALGALLPLAIPLDRLLAAATVPELPTAALVTYAVVAAARAPWSAAVCVLLACLSRYEAWPAAAWACGTIAATSSGPRASRIGAAATSIVGPLAWLAWNAHAHGDALNFARRVASYQTGLGRATNAASYGTSLLVEAGAIVLLALVAVWALDAEARHRFLGPLGGAALLLVAPTAAALFGGAPTHHPERAVVAVWTIAAIVAAGAGPEAAVAQARVRPASLTLAGIALVLAQGAWRSPLTSAGLGPTRAEEIELGLSLGREIPAGERFLLVPPSFGYLATIVASGRSADARVVVRREIDPRGDEPGDPMTSPERLSALAEREGAAWVIALPGQREALSRTGMAVRSVPGGAIARVVR